MSRYTASTNDRETIKHIVATLLSFANMAERVSMRSRPVIWLLLWILRPAEARARSLVISASEDFGLQANLPASESLTLEHGCRTEVLLFAASFRYLAAMLDTLAALVALEGSTYRKTALARVLSRLEAGLRSLRVEHHCFSPGYNDSS